MLAKFEPLLGSLETPQTNGSATATSKMLPDGSIRPLICVAPGCGKRNKGPRSGYTCDDHKSASPAQKKAWRRAFGEAERLRHQAPPPKKRRKGPSREETLATAAANKQKIMKFVRSHSGCSIQDLATGTGFTLTYVRGWMFRLKKAGEVKVKGKTTNARYFVT